MVHPPFCPNPRCTLHHSRRRPPGWYHRAGRYLTAAFGEVQRFHCRLCGRFFSSQTFSIDYYGKRTLSYSRLFTHLITTSSIRDMARDFEVSVDVVLNKLSRLARNCIGVLQELQRDLRLSEHLVADGLESFIVSQYFPSHINLLAGKRSQLVYGFDQVILRRKGRMTGAQKRRRRRLERIFRADPKGIERSFGRLYRLTAQLICEGRRAAVCLFTDRHGAYLRARRGDVAITALSAQGRFAHRRISSRAARTRTNPLFALNYLDRQLRKDLAEHVRETVCFARNANRSAERLAIYLVYHNLKKPFREAQGDMRTHAEVAGMSSREARRLTYRLFTRRAFLSKVRPEGSYRTVWMSGYVTPLKRGREYLPLHVAA